jgi:hypothetical protein
MHATNRSYIMGERLINLRNPAVFHERLKVTRTEETLEKAPSVANVIPLDDLQPI